MTGLTFSVISWCFIKKALLVSFTCFTDDKLLKFNHCRHKIKIAQNDHFYTLVGIALLVHLPARQHTSTHYLRDH